MHAQVKLAVSPLDREEDRLMGSTSHRLANWEQALEWVPVRDRATAHALLRMLPQPPRDITAGFMFENPIAWARVDVGAAKKGRVVIYPTRLTLVEGLGEWVVDNLPAQVVQQRLRITDTGTHQLVYNPADVASTARGGARGHPRAPQRLSECCHMVVTPTGRCTGCDEPVAS